MLSSPPSRVYLIGARASGKSTTGKLLAQNMGWNFVETDALVEKHIGKSIAEIVSEKGWIFFRNAEEEALCEAAKSPHTVISTGGGIVLRESNCTLMKETGLIVYLKVSAKELQRRLKINSAGRPSLTGASPAEEIEAVLAEREPIYKSLATALVNGEENSKTVAADVASLLLSSNKILPD